MIYNISHATTQIKAAEYIRNYRDVHKFIAYCRQCNRYGNCWACPPYDFDTDSFISSYEYLHIIGTKIVLEDEVRNSCTDTVQQIELGKKILTEVRFGLDKYLLHLENIYTGSKAFFAGTCHLCPENECTRINGKPCIHPGEIRHSLESFGFDIGKTTSDLLGIELKWSSDGQLPEYFILVSGLFTNHVIKGLDPFNQILNSLF